MISKISSGSIKLHTAQRCVLGRSKNPAHMHGSGSRKAGLRVEAALSTNKVPRSAGPRTGGERPRVLPSRVLPLISELMEANALTLKYETIAGRGAMIGLIVATTFELIVPTKGISAWESTQDLAWVGALLISMAAALAAVQTRQWRSQRLLEPVIASLTAQQRSAGSLSKQNVDKAVDYILDTVFSHQMMKRNFPLDD